MLKVINQIEVESIAKYLQSLVGAQLQEVIVQDPILGLGFYHERKTMWLVIDLTPSKPWVALKSSLKLKSKMKPLGLFLKAHFVGRRLNAVKCLKEYGRVLEFDFGGRILQVRLIPHAVNAIVVFEDKALSWNKVKELEPAKSFEDPNPRTFEVISEEWGTQKKSATAPSPEKAISKKKKAIEMLESDLAREEWKMWRDLGDWLKTHQTLKVPSSLRQMLDMGLNVIENMERAFEKSAKLKEKQSGTRERLKVLREEVKSLEQGELPKKTETLYEKSISGRRHPIKDGVELYVGKSGSDNLQLLRKANPWDLWVHLRDFPGAYGILHLNRGVKVSEDIMAQAAHKVAQESARKHISDGDKYDCLFVECRFVRPIKGAKAGRVTYREEMVRRYVYKG